MFIELDAGTRKFYSGMDRAERKWKTTMLTMRKDADRFKTGVMASFAGIGAGMAFQRLASNVTSVAADYGTEMSAVKAVTQATETQMEALDKRAREMGASMKFTASEAASGMKFLGMAGFETNDIIESIPHMLNLAAAGMLDLGQAADIASNIMTAFNIDAKDSGKAVDILATIATSANTNIEMLGDGMKYVGPVASGLGVTLEETAAAIGVLSNAGIQGEMAGTSLRRIIVELANPTAALRKAVSGLNIDLTDLSPRTHSLAEIFRTLNEAGAGVEQLMSMFGQRGGPGAIKLVELVDHLDRLHNKALNATGSSSEMARVMNENLAGAFTRISSKLEAATLQLGQGGYTQALTEFLDGIGAGIDNLIEGGKLEDLGASLGNIIDLGTGVIQVWMDMEDPLDDRIEDFENLAKTIEGVGAALGTITAGAAVWGTFGLLKSMGPGGWTLAGVAAGVGVLYRYRDEIQSLIDPLHKQRLEWEKHIKTVEHSIKKMDPLIEQYQKLVTNVDRTEKEESELVKTKEKLIELFPNLSKVIDGSTESLERFNQAMRRERLDASMLFSKEKVSVSQTALDSAFEKERALQAQIDQLTNQRLEKLYSGQSVTGIASLNLDTLAPAPIGSTEEKLVQEHKKLMETIEKLKTERRRALEDYWMGKYGFQRNEMNAIVSQIMISMTGITTTFAEEEKKFLDTNKAFDQDVQQRGDIINDFARKLQKAMDDYKTEQKSQIDNLRQQTMTEGELYDQRIEKLNEWKALFLITDKEFLKFQDYYNRELHADLVNWVDTLKYDMEAFGKTNLEIHEDNIKSLNEALGHEFITPGEHSKMRAFMEDEFHGIVEASRSSASAVHDMWKDVFKGAVSGALDFEQILTNLVSRMTDTWADFGATNVFNWLQPQAFEAGGFSKFLFGGGRAEGGDVFPEYAYWVGEKGQRELFVPQTAGRIVPEDQLGGGGLNIDTGGAPFINVTGGNLSKKSAGQFAQDFLEAVQAGGRYQ